MLRRHVSRCLRLRNLAVLTALAALLCLARSLSRPGPAPLAAPRRASARASEMPFDYFVPENLEKIDWHNYTQIEEESKRTGIGEQGRPAGLPAAQAARERELYAANGFNGALSDAISLERALPDIRHPGCRAKRYLRRLPGVSVVVPFHDEHWSTLLRTARSVLLRSPPELLREVLLVDDASTKAFLGAELERYLAAHMPRVRVLRLATRRGLIAARLAGARAAAGDVLVFLDSHCEAAAGWLPPLLEPIALDPRTVVCPFIDVLAHDTFEYRAQDGGARGAFDWELYYKRLPLRPRDERRLPEPFESPVMAGGLFAIARGFFWHLGGYDEGLDIWGGEQYELSFKVWQCGGRMLDAPCSRVGHVYRKFAPFPNPGVGDFVGRNYRRVADVWMDEYAQYVYARRPHYRALDPGDLEPRRALRRRLRCKPFRWFMTEVAPDLVEKYPPVEPPPFAAGAIRPLAAPDWCADARGGAALAELALSRCADAADPDELLFDLTWHRDIKCRRRDVCWDVPETAPGSAVRLFPCHHGGGNQRWTYRPETQQLVGPGGVCAEHRLAPPAVFVAPCGSARAQRWLVAGAKAPANASATPAAEPSSAAPRF